MLPAAEEKQILDAIKILLDNGYTLSEAEIIQIFDMIGLQGLKLSVECTEIERQFFEFVFYMGKVFEIEIKKIEEYFSKRPPENLRGYELTATREVAEYEEFEIKYEKI
jgi:tRNA threonylcarbamoyladenosine modification (KEOPS) complex Cgi121 subunit